MAVPVGKPKPQTTWTTADKEKLCVLVATHGKTLNTAAKELGIPPPTAYFWKQNDPEFASMLETAHKQWYAGTGDRIKGLVDKVYKEMEHRLTDDEERAKIATKDLNMMAAVQIDKLGVVSQIERHGVERTQGATSDALVKMLHEFESIVDRANAKVIDGEVTKKPTHE